MVRSVMPDCRCPGPESVFLREIHLSSAEMELLELLCLDIPHSEIALRSNRTTYAVSQQLCRLAHRAGYRTVLGLAVWWTRSRSALYIRPVILKPAVKVKSAAAL
jgi:hypothetical protein